jgi:hypothetical protein
LEEIAAAPVKKTENTTGGIRCADHATPSISKSWYYFAKKRRSLGRHGSLADQSHGVFFLVFFNSVAENTKGMQRMLNRLDCCLSTPTHDLGAAGFVFAIKQVRNWGHKKKLNEVISSNTQKYRVGWGLVVVLHHWQDLALPDQVYKVAGRQTHA